MNYKESEAKFEKIKFEVEMMPLPDLCGLSQKLISEIDGLKSKLYISDEDKQSLWFKKRILKMVKLVIKSRQLPLFKD